MNSVLVPAWNGTRSPRHVTAVDAAAKAALDREAVEYAAPAGADGSVFDVPAITAGQYNRVIEALTAAGEPGVDWNFTLD